MTLICRPRVFSELSREKCSKFLHVTFEKQLTKICKLWYLAQSKSTMKNFSSVISSSRKKEKKKKEKKKKMAFQFSDFVTQTKDFFFGLCNFRGLAGNKIIPVTLTIIFAFNSYWNQSIMARMLVLGSSNTHLYTTMPKFNPFDHFKNLWTFPRNVTPQIGNVHNK